MFPGQILGLVLVYVLIGCASDIIDSSAQGLLAPD